MKSKIIFLTIFIIISNEHTSSIRLHKLFRFIDGYHSEHGLRGFLHVGNEYAVFLRAPHHKAKLLTYELYETKNVKDIKDYKPGLLAISKVPVDYIKDQLRVYRSELHKAKYENSDIVPGTQVKTLREWQIDRALNFPSSMTPKNFGNNVSSKVKKRKEVINLKMVL